MFGHLDRLGVERDQMRTKTKLNGSPRIPESGALFVGDGSATSTS
jgi:hypothetical protein